MGSLISRVEWKLLPEGASNEDFQIRQNLLHLKKLQFVPAGHVFFHGQWRSCGVRNDTFGVLNSSEPSLQ
jgi:hypothetical protein